MRGIVRKALIGCGLWRVKISAIFFTLPFNDHDIDEELEKFRTTLDYILYFLIADQQACMYICDRVARTLSCGSHVLWLHR